MDFLNDLGKKFSHAARTVQELTREGVESGRLNSELRAARAELEAQYAELGRAYYEALAGKREVSTDLVERVRVTLATIDALNRQKDCARSQTRCPACGAAQAEGTRFCSNCGRRMPERAPEIDESVADEGCEYCPECGAMRCGPSDYCAVCGRAFNESKPAVFAERPLPAADAPEEPDPSDLN